MSDSVFQKARWLVIMTSDNLLTRHEVSITGADFARDLEHRRDAVR